jgi:hypothetical protein
MKNFITKTVTEILNEQLLGKLILVHVFKHPESDWFIYNSVNKTNNDEVIYLGASYKCINKVAILNNYEEDEPDIYLELNVPSDECVIFKHNEKMHIRNEYEILEEDFKGV